MRSKRLPSALSVVIWPASPGFSTYLRRIVSYVHDQDPDRPRNGGEDRHQQQDRRRFPREPVGYGRERSPQERRVRPARPRPPEKGEPQGAYGTQSADRRAHQDSCQDHREVLSREAREGFHRPEEVIRRSRKIKGRRKPAFLILETVALNF